MKSPESLSDLPAVVDTVVLRYFLLVDQFDLLLQVLGAPIMVPRIVYDPDDRNNEVVHSEMARSIQHQKGRAADPNVSQAERERAMEFAGKLSSIHGHLLSDRITPVEMNHQERFLYSQLCSDESSSEYGTAFSLNDGEAACLAIAVERKWVLVTDDNDALRALRVLRQDHPYRRIRRILIDAAEAGLVDLAVANRIHAEMRRCGFWDTTPPFT